MRSSPGREPNWRGPWKFGWRPWCQPRVAWRQAPSAPAVGCSAPPRAWPESGSGSVPHRPRCLSGCSRPEVTADDRQNIRLPHVSSTVLAHPLIFVFLNRVLFLLGGWPLRPLEVIQGLSEIMLQPLSLQPPLSRVHRVLLGVAVKVPQLEAAVLGQLLGVMLNLVPDDNQSLKLTN